MWELDCEEGWAPKNWCFWTVVLEKTLESPLDCKEIQPVHSEGDQPWDFFGRNDAKAETPVLWPPHVKSWLIGKDSDAGRDWGQEEKGTTDDEMAEWHHWLDRHKSEWTPGVCDGQEGLAYCDSWGHKESDTTKRLNWTESSSGLLYFLQFKSKSITLVTQILSFHSEPAFLQVFPNILEHFCCTYLSSLWNTYTVTPETTLKCMHLTPTEPLFQSRHADLLSLHSATCIFHYLDYDTEVMLQKHSCNLKLIFFDFQPLYQHTWSAPPTSTFFLSLLFCFLVYATLMKKNKSITSRAISWSLIHWQLASFIQCYIKQCIGR